MGYKKEKTMKLKSVIKILLGMTLFSNIAIAQENTIYMQTEQYPPYNMLINNQAEGASVDIVDRILKSIGSKQTKKDIKVINWSRAYNMALKKKNYVVFSTLRKPSREDLFKWVGPIGKTVKDVIALKKSKITINNPKDFNNYQIGTILNDSAEELLESIGVDKSHIQGVSGTNAIALSFKKLQNNRIDMFALNSKVLKYHALTNGINWDNYEIVHTLKTGDVYLAFNKETDDKLIQTWQNALDKLKENGIYDKIHQKY